jgi:hypothetical protein
MNRPQHKKEWGMVMSLPVKVSACTVFIILSTAKSCVAKQSYCKTPCILCHVCWGASGRSSEGPKHVEVMRGLNLVNDQLDALFSMYLFHASTCFELQVLTIRRIKLCQLILLMMSTCSAKHVEEWNKYIEKSASSWSLTRITSRCCTVNKI